APPAARGAVRAFVSGHGSGGEQAEYGPPGERDVRVRFGGEPAEHDAGEHAGVRVRPGGSDPRGGSDELHRGREGEHDGARGGPLWVRPGEQTRERDGGWGGQRVRV